MDIENTPEHLKAIKGHAVPRNKVTKQYFYFFAIITGLPWALIGLHLVGKYDNLFLEILITAVVFFLAYIVGYTVEFQVRCAAFGRVLHTYFESLLVNKDLRDHWNEVAKDVCPRAVVYDTEELKAEDLNDVFRA